MNPLIDQIASILSPRQRPWQANPLIAAQSLIDSAAPGSVGAPGGVNPMSQIGLGGSGHDPMLGLLGLGSMLPGVGGDILGPMAEERKQPQKPKGRGQLENAQDRG